MDGDQRLAVLINDATRKEARRTDSAAGSFALPVGGQHLLNSVPYGPINDRRVFSGMDLTLMMDLANVKGIGEQLVNLPSGEWTATCRPPGLGNALGRNDTFAGQLADNQSNIPQIKVAREDVSHDLGMLIDDLSCPLLSGPSTVLVWTMKEKQNAIEEAQAGGDHRQTA
jgi:hypothetical protein